MEKDSRIIRFLRRFFWILLYIVGIGIILPVIMSILAGFSAGVTISFILSAFALQAAVPPVGVALGLPVPLILAILACFAAGVVLGIYEICITLGASSGRVSAFIGKVEKKTEKYPIIKKYGPVTCILIAWIPGIGLYGTPVIAWMLGWRRIPSVICTTAGFLIASIFVLFFASRINQVLHFAALSGLLVYSVTLSLAIGLSLPASRIAGSVRNPMLLFSLIFVNFVLVPLAAYLLGSYLALPQGSSTGLILISVSAGAPSLFAFFQKAGGTMARLSPVLALLCIATVISIPLLLLFLPMHGDPAMAALCLGLLFMIPLLAALYFRLRHETIAAMWGPRLDKVSWIAFSVMVITMLVLFTTAFFEVPGTMSLLAAVLLVLVAYAIGFASGGWDKEARQVFALVTPPRNLAAALLVAALVIREGPVIAMVLICGLLGLVPFMILWWSMRKKRKSAVIPT